MPDDTARITIHMACSLDGFIAKRDGSTSWFETKDNYDKGVDYGDVEGFLAAIDCYVMGSKTYELALELGWIYGDKPTVVLTSRTLPRERDTIRFHSGSLHDLMTRLLAAGHRNIWVVGGAVLARDFIRAGLADEISLSILPITLGDGTPLLAGGELERALHLKDVSAYKNGVVGLTYEIMKGQGGPTS